MRILRLPSNRRSVLVSVLAGAALTAGTLVVASSSGAAAAPGTEATLRAVSARYHSVTRALDDGFLPTEECAELPGVGGMGYHFVHPGRLADPVDAEKPDILLYVEDGHGKLRLAGVEWLAPDPDQDLSTSAGRPTLFGQPFDGPMPGHGPGMPIHFDLHAWVWKANPAGMFAAWNPAVSC